MSKKDKKRSDPDEKFNEEISGGPVFDDFDEGFDEDEDEAIDPQTFAQLLQGGFIIDDPDEAESDLMQEQARYAYYRADCDFVESLLNLQLTQFPYYASSAQTGSRINYPDTGFGCLMHAFGPCYAIDYQQDYLVRVCNLNFEKQIKKYQNPEELYGKSTALGEIASELGEYCLLQPDVLMEINEILSEIFDEINDAPVSSHPVSFCLNDKETLLEYDQAYEVIPVKPSYSKPSKTTGRLDVNKMICPVCRQDLKGAKKAKMSDDMYVGEVPEQIYYDYTQYTCPHCGFRFTDVDPDDLYPIIAPFRISIQDLCTIATVKLGGIFAKSLKLPDLNQNMVKKDQSEEQWFAACASLFLRPVKGYLKSLVAQNSCVYSDILRLKGNDGSDPVKACLLHTPEWADDAAVYLDLQNTDIAAALAKITGSKVESADFERGLQVDDGKSVKGRENKADLYGFLRKISYAVASYDQKYLRSHGKSDFFKIKTLFKKLRVSKIIDGSFSYQNPMDVLVFLLSLMSKCCRLMHIENCVQLKTLSEHEDRGSFECYAQMIRDRHEARAKMQSYKTEIDTIASALAKNCLTMKKKPLVINSVKHNLGFILAEPETGQIAVGRSAPFLRTSS